MLIKIFGIWLMSTQIVNLSPSDRYGCAINMTTSQGIVYSSPLLRGKTCDEVAEEINKQLKE